RLLRSFATRRSSDLRATIWCAWLLRNCPAWSIRQAAQPGGKWRKMRTVNKGGKKMSEILHVTEKDFEQKAWQAPGRVLVDFWARSEEHTSELQTRFE